MNVKQHLACSWAVYEERIYVGLSCYPILFSTFLNKIRLNLNCILFTSADQHYIWTSLSFRCYLLYRIIFFKCGISTRKRNKGEVNFVSLIQISRVLQIFWKLNYRVTHEFAISFSSRTKNRRATFLIWKKIIQHGLYKMNMFIYITVNNSYIPASNRDIYITVNNSYIPASNRDIYLEIDNASRLKMKRYE
jgi:hypothetical protein